MAQINHFKASFDEAKDFDKYSNYALWISTILLGIGLGIESYDNDLEYVSGFISNINCFFILAFAILNFISGSIFFDASIQRRVDFIDNSFDSSFNEDRSREYYTNENIASGIYKMAVNGFENSLFTYTISKEMITKLWLKNMIFGILILIFAIGGFNNAFILMLQLTLPLLLLQQAIKHSLFVYRIKRVFENYKRLFNDLKQLNDSKQKRPEIILNVLDYETTLTYGGIHLDSKIYNKLNLDLSIKWDEMKQTYNIE